MRLIHSNGKKIIEFASEVSMTYHTIRSIHIDFFKEGWVLEFAFWNFFTTDQQKNSILRLAKQRGINVLVKKGESKCLRR